MTDTIQKLINSDGTWNNEHYMKVVKGNKRYLQELYEGLSNKDPLLREGCAEALGDIGLVQSVPPLIEHADDLDENVRWDIVNSLEKILGFRPGGLLVWAGCPLRHRHKLKRRLQDFWKCNEAFLLQRGSPETFWVPGA